MNGTRKSLSGGSILGYPKNGQITGCASRYTRPMTKFDPGDKVHLNGAYGASPPDGNEYNSFRITKSDIGEVLKLETENTYLVKFEGGESLVWEDFMILVEKAYRSFGDPEWDSHILKWKEFFK